MRNDLVIGMAGAGGDGVIAAGEALIAAAAIEGYYARMTKSFGSQIRGGESSFRLRMSTTPVLSLGGALDVAVALNWDDFLRFGSELPVGGRTVVVYESRTGVAPDRIPLTGITPAEVIAVPIDQMARDTVGHERAKNTIVLGLLSGWFSLPAQGILAGLKKRFAAKGEETVLKNEMAFNAGVLYAREHPLTQGATLAPPSPNATKRLIADGNAMCGAGAIAAGCKFFGGYPITPSTEIMQFLSKELFKYGGTVLQAEDEIAGIGAAIGASFAGRKAMTATSGPGMSLKSEMLGLATIAELPLVAVNVQRGGPSTGIPTKSEQSDLFQAVFSAHGDAVRPVLAPVDVSDIFGITIEAFNIAEKYQTPVIILSDGDIGQRKETVDPFNVDAFPIVERQRPTPDQLSPYVRFRLTDSGVSPISEPGMPGGNYLASGIEHTQTGAPTATGSVHAEMTAKRARKLEPLKRRRDLFIEYGQPGAPLALVSWGSVAGIAREALELARREGLRVKLLVPKLIYPVPEEVYAAFFASVQGGLVVEQSYQGQLWRLLKMFVDVPKGIEPFARPSAVPISPEELVARLKQLAVELQRGRVPEAAPVE
ncbi:MAG TPA: 2-oxoacid:acceptor oxidoreductase subunit alpha [Vicinamibacterales bacterium]|nr:2-oxoacid:acceptor oxidoreductase subunit alpha [Vicinamibacterales bacterium]